MLSGSTGLAKSIEVHEMGVSHGVMTMRPIDGGLTIDPGETVKLAPGGRHLMFLGLKGPLKQGEHIPVTLMFEHAGEIEVSFEVQGLGRAGACSRSQFRDGRTERRINYLGS